MLHGIFAKTKIERELFFDAVKAGNSAEKGVSKKYMPGKDIV